MCVSEKLTPIHSVQYVSWDESYICYVLLYSVRTASRQNWLVFNVKKKKKRELNNLNREPLKCMMMCRLPIPTRKYKITLPKKPGVLMHYFLSSLPTIVSAFWLTSVLTWLFATVLVGWIKVMRPSDQSQLCWTMNRLNSRINIDFKHDSASPEIAEALPRLRGHLPIPTHQTSELLNGVGRGRKWTEQ